MATKQVLAAKTAMTGNEAAAQAMKQINPDVTNQPRRRRRVSHYSADGHRTEVLRVRSQR